MTSVPCDSLAWFSGIGFMDVEPPHVHVPLVGLLD